MDIFRILGIRLIVLIIYIMGVYNIECYEEFSPLSFINLNSSNEEEKLLLRNKRNADDPNNFDDLKQSLKGVQGAIEKLTDTIDTLNIKLSGESQNSDKFIASVNNKSTHFTPDDIKINFGGADDFIHVNENTNVAPKVETIVSPDLTKLENSFQKFFNEFFSFLNRTEEKDKISQPPKQETTTQRSELLLNKVDKEMVDEFSKETKQIVAILSQLRLIVILFGLVLLFLYTVKIIKSLKNERKQEYDGLSMEMPIINEGQHSRF